MNNPWMQTASGRRIDLVDLHANVWDVEDVAHALSHLCRYGGHVSRFYSVAEHSYHCAVALEAMQLPHLVVFTGLMHDAPEAYLGDVPRGLKSLLPDYRLLESRLAAHLSSAFGFSNPTPAVVNLVDNRIVVNEVAELMAEPNDCDWSPLDGLKPLDVTIRCWDPATAKRKFLNKFDELYPKALKQLEVVNEPPC